MCLRLSEVYSERYCRGYEYDSCWIIDQEILGTMWPASCGTLVTLVLLPAFFRGIFVTLFVTNLSLRKPSYLEVLIHAARNF